MRNTLASEGSSRGMNSYKNAKKILGKKRNQSGLLSSTLAESSEWTKSLPKSKLIFCQTTREMFLLRINKEKLGNKKEES